MKRISTILSIMLFLVAAISAQVAVNTDGSQPDASAMMDVKSTEQGFLPPRMTTAERDGISSPAEGLTIYNIDEQCIEFYNGDCWESACLVCGDDVTFTYHSVSVTYGTVRSSCNCWLDRNLGASQVATSSTDYLAYGSLFQWGRAAEGHEIINWTSSTTSDGTEQSRESTTLATTSVPNAGNPAWDGLFITSSSDWLTTPDVTLWQGASGTNNPCPAGYRLPTDTEWNWERTNWSSNNSAGAFASPLILPVAGTRSVSNGVLNDVGSFGYYWSSTVNGIFSRYLAFNSSNAFMGSLNRSYGFSTRCIKD